MPEISDAPEKSCVKALHPVYVVYDHCVKIEIQESARHTAGFKHLHLIPPGFLGSGYARPIMQYMLDHVVGHRSVRLGKNMESHWTSAVAFDHVVQTFHIAPVILVAVYHAGTIHGAVYCSLSESLFSHRPWAISSTVYSVWQISTNH